MLLPPLPPCCLLRFGEAPPNWKSCTRDLLVVDRIHHTWTRCCSCPFISYSIGNALSLSLSANDSFACFETSASSCCVFGRFHSNFKTATMLLREFRSNDDALSLSCVDLSSQISHSIKASPALFSQHHLKRNWSHTRRRERGGREPRTRMQEKCVQLTSHENKLKVTLHTTSHSKVVNET